MGTLIINNTIAQKVVGVDVIHGFEQQLITENSDDDMIIHDFLVKD